MPLMLGVFRVEAGVLLKPPLHFCESRGVKKFGFLPNTSSSVFSKSTKGT